MEPQPLPFPPSPRPGRGRPGAILPAAGIPRPDPHPPRRQAPALPIPSPDTRRLLRERVPASAPVVLVECGGPLGLCRSVGIQVLTVGREPGLALVLDDPAVSSVHCGLSLKAGRVEVQDFGSTNGTWLDGHRVTHGEARDGSTLEVGETVLRLFLRTRSRVAFERARLHLGLWQGGRDPDTRLRHGGALHRDLGQACRAARRTGAAVHLVLLDVLRVSRGLARRLEAAVPPGARAYRHGTRRLAVLTRGPPPLGRLVRAVGAVAAGVSEGAAVGHDPDRLLLAAAAATRPVTAAAVGIGTSA